MERNPYLLLAFFVEEGKVLAKVRVFPTGKVPPDVLKEIVFNKLGAENPSILLGPSVGEDAAVIRIGSKALVITTDPITGATGNIGWLAIHVNANDIATRGVRPAYFFCTILLPEGADPEVLRSIMTEMDEAARSLGVAIVGGHSETTPGLNRPLIAGFMLGEASLDGYVTTSGAQEGDLIVLTKGAGIEGTAILAYDLREELRRQVRTQVLDQAVELFKSISVVKEAMIAMSIGGVHSMHDPTEGGVLNGIWEMAEAAGKGVKILPEKIPVRPETKEVCDFFGIDPLSTLGSGALLLAIGRDKVDLVVRALHESGIDASVIGEVTCLEQGRVLLRPDGRHDRLEPPGQDHVYKVLSRYSPV